MPADRPTMKVLRWRFVLLALWAVPWFAVSFAATWHSTSDWLIFEYGARVMVHLNSHYPGGALHVYANFPNVQIGPPALLPVAAVQGISPSVAALVFAVAMLASGLVVIRCIEAIAVTRRPESANRAKVLTLLGGALVMAAWATGIGRYRHFDDVMALTLVALAGVLLVRRPRSWLPAAVLIGTAAAAKPWAIIVVPLLLVVPRARRASALLVSLAVCAAWWFPFVAGDSRTVSALGSFRLYLDPRSALHAIGVHALIAPAWVRPIQLVGGAVVVALAVRRRRWAAAPLAGMAVRIVVDPQIWAYYGMGPIAAALLLDAAGTKRRLPVWTIATAAALYGVPAVHVGSAGIARLGWAICVVASACLAGTSARQDSSQVHVTASDAVVRTILRERSSPV